MSLRHESPKSMADFGNRDNTELDKPVCHGGMLGRETEHGGCSGCLTDQRLYAIIPAQHVPADIREHVLQWRCFMNADAPGRTIMARSSYNVHVVSGAVAQDIDCPEGEQ